MQIITIGSIVIGALHYCGEGVVYAIHGEQAPESVRSLGAQGIASIGFTGGSATLDVVFMNGSRSLGLPECIIRGSQWEVTDQVVSPVKIEMMLTHADLYTARIKREAEQASKTRSETVATLRAESEYAHLAQGSDYSGKLAAKNIRATLKLAFKGVRFSVCKTCYGSVSVSWTDGPKSADVEVLINRYKRGSFNGMEDIYEDDNSPWCEVFGGVEYLSVQRTHSDALIQAAIDKAFTDHAAQLAQIAARPSVQDYKSGNLYLLGEVWVGGNDYRLDTLIRTVANSITSAA